jgi:hypothetical protein
MPVYVDTTKPEPIRSFRLDVGKENISVRFGRDMPPQVVRERILQALNAMLPEDRK